MGAAEEPAWLDYSDDADKFMPPIGEWDKMTADYDAIAEDDEAAHAEAIPAKDAEQ